MREVLLASATDPARRPDPARADASRGPIPALIARLAARKVRYCHWKSNVRLAESLAGDEDLDLLVSRPDAGAFFAALSESGFKLAKTAFGGGHPGVLHAFALDPSELRLVHVHAYFQVVTGDSLVKSYRLPFEDLLLDTEMGLGDVPVPRKEAELLVFLLRVVLKHTGVVETFMVNRNYAAVPQELTWLRQGCDECATRNLWLERVPGASRGEFDELLRAVANPRMIRQRARHGLALAWRLRTWRRLPFATAQLSRMRRVALLLFCRARGRRPTRLATGGAVIALVGPKASGKSTLGAALADRLGKRLDLRRIHAGKPPATLLSAPLLLLLPLIRRAMPGERSGEYQKAERRTALRFSYVYLLRMLLLAHDRRRLICRSQRAARAGAIVIADRYPSPGAGAIDGSQFGEAALAACGSALKRQLMRLENRLYRDLPQPDLVVRLSAPIETTLRRDAARSKREGPDPDGVLRRRDLETVAEFPGAPVLPVSSDEPLDQTISKVLDGVWRTL